MIITKRDRNGFTLLKKCFSFFSEFRIALVFAFLIISMNLLLVSLLLYYEYSTYSINIFDTETLYNILELDVWEHLTRIFYLLLLLSFSAFWTTICNIGITFTLLQHLNNKSHNFPNIFNLTLSKVRIVLHTAALFVADRFNTLLDIILFQGMIIRIAHYLQGKNLPPLIEIHAPEGLLFFPLIVEKNYTVPEALEESHELLEKTFAEPLNYNVSFNSLKFFIFMFVISTFGVTTHYNYNLLPAIIVTLTFSITFYTIIDSVLFLFKACVYNYVQGKSTGPFTKKEITLYFT